MRAVVIAALVLAAVAGTNAFVVQVPQANLRGVVNTPAPAVAPTNNITTNICDLDWYYCPREYVARVCPCRVVCPCRPLVLLLAHGLSYRGLAGRVPRA